MFYPFITASIGPGQSFLLKPDGELMLGPGVAPDIATPLKNFFAGDTPLSLLNGPKK